MRALRARSVLLMVDVMAMAVMTVMTLAGPAHAAAAAPQQRAMPAAPGPELVARRTATSRTFQAPDGRRMTRVYGVPVNFREGGRWKAIDNTLVAADQAGFVHRRANDGDALIPRDLSQPFTVSRDGRWVSFALDGAQGTAQVGGSQATFAGALSGIDAAYAATDTGLKETLTLHDASAASTFSYKVKASAGLSPRTTASGAVVFADAGGHDRFAFTPPVAWDPGSPASRTRPLKLDVEPTGDGWTLTATLDRLWLVSSDRRFPVTVDPNIQWITGGTMRYSGAQRDCTLSSATPSTSLCADPALDVGSDANGTYKALLYFDARQAIPQDSTIYDAQMLAYAGGSGTAPASNLRVRRITSDWTNAATWSTSDGSTAWGTPGGDVGSGSDDVGDPLSVTWLANWYKFPVPAGLVQSWIWGDEPDYGLQLSADAGSPQQVYSFESTDGDPYKWPALDLWWREDSGNAGFYTQETFDLGDRAKLSVNVANGNLTFSADELSLPGTAGMDIGVKRIWQSVDPWDQSTFARGWSDSYSEMWLRYNSDGSVAYDDMTGRTWRFAPAGNGTFTSPTGVNATLCEIDVASGCSRDGVSADATYKLTYNKSGLRYYYWPSGRTATIKDRNDNTVTLDWESSTITVSGTEGRQITYSIDGNGYTTSLSDGTRSTSYVRDTDDKLQSSTDLAGKSWQYEYDSNYDLTKVTDPLGHETRIEWEWVPDFGGWRATKVIRVLDATDPTNPAKNPTTTYSYDTANRTTVVTDPAGNATTSVSDDGQTTYHYDKHLRVTKTINPKGLESDTSWTPNSDVAEFDDQPGTAQEQTSVFEYNGPGLGDLTKATQGAGEVTTIGYNSAGLFPQSEYAPKEAHGPDGQSQYYGYDGAGNLTDIKDGDPSDSTYTSARNQAHLDYGSSPTDGTVKSATDGNGNTTTFGYANHQLTSITPQADSNSSLGATSLTYDGFGRVKTVADANGVTHTFCYDAMDRVTRDEVDAGDYITYTYDDAGNLIERREVHGTASTTTDYGYDAMNRRTSETFPGYSNNYTYTLDSQLATITEPSGTTSYDYDALDRVSQITDPAGAQVGYSYDDTGSSGTPRSRTVTLPDSSMAEQTFFDQSGKPTKIEVKSGSTVRLSRTYDYGTGKSKIQSVTDQDGTVTAYQYGQDGELTDATRTTSGGSTEEWSYTFDKALNRLTMTHTQPGHSAVTTTYAYNKDNQLCWKLVGTSSNGCGDAPSGATTYSYDADGNQLTGGSGGSFAYDDWNRLVTIGSADLAYTSPTNGELASYGTTSYTNDVLGLSSQTTGSDTTSYVRDPSGAPIAQRRSSSGSAIDTDYLLSDALGSTIGLVNGTSTSPVKTYTYDPDGNATASTGGPTTDLKFAGGQALSAGLYHFGARYYDPSTGRWTQRDPLNQANSLTQANRYAYVGGDPINYADSLGLFSLSLNASVEFGPIHVDVGISGDTSGHLGGSLGFGGGEGAGAGLTVEGGSGDIEGGESIQGSGCAGAVLSVCASGSSRSSGLGAGFGDEAGISYRHTWVIGG